MGTVAWDRPRLLRSIPAPLLYQKRTKVLIKKKLTVGPPLSPSPIGKNLGLGFSLLEGDSVIGKGILFDLREKSDGQFQLKESDSGIYDLLPALQACLMENGSTGSIGQPPTLSLR